MAVSCSQLTAHAVLEVRVEVDGVGRRPLLLLGGRRPLEGGRSAERLEEDAREGERVRLGSRSSGGRDIVGGSHHGSRAGENDTGSGAHVE